VKRIIEHLGHSVLLARDADVGFQIANRLKPGLVLIDISSDGEGVQLAKRLREHLDTPIIFVGSSLAAPTAAQILEELPGASVLQRPVSRKELAKAVELSAKPQRLLRNEDFEILLRFTREPPDLTADIHSSSFDACTAELLRLMLLELDRDKH
jgi:DNA-binding response OmpR family regulator